MKFKADECDELNDTKHMNKQHTHEYHTCVVRCIQYFSNVEHHSPSVLVLRFNRVQQYFIRGTTTWIKPAVAFKRAILKILNVQENQTQLDIICCPIILLFFQTRNFWVDEAPSSIAVRRVGLQPRQQFAADHKHRAA